MHLDSPVRRRRTRTAHRTAHIHLRLAVYSYQVLKPCIFAVRKTSHSGVHTSGSGCLRSSTSGNSSRAIPVITWNSSLKMMISWRDGCPRNMSNSTSRNRLRPSKLASLEAAEWHATSVAYRYWLESLFSSVMT